LLLLLLLLLLLVSLLSLALSHGASEFPP